MGLAAILGDVATWVTGIATLILIYIGFLQIKNERESRIKNDLQINLQKRREQAEKVACWIIGETDDDHGHWIWVAILNQSTQPIYQAIANLTIIRHTGEVVGNDTLGNACIGLVPPGKGFIAISALYAGHFRRAESELAFRDSAGVNWVRKANGELWEIGEDTVFYYNIDLPAGWQGLMTEPPDELNLNDMAISSKRS